MSESETIPQLKILREKITVSIDIYEDELLSLQGKSHCFNELILSSQQRLQGLYENKEMYSLVQVKESRLSEEKSLKNKVDGDIAVIKKLIKAKKSEEKSFFHQIEHHEACVNFEKLTSTLLNSIKMFEAQLIEESDDRKGYERGDFLFTARVRFISFFNDNDNKHISFLKDSTGKLKVNQAEIHALLYHCSLKFQEANFCQPSLQDSHFLSFIRFLRGSANNHYNQCASKLMVKGETLQTGEFYCREIDQKIDSDFLVDATVFLSIYIGAQYIACEETFSSLPEEVTSYIHTSIEFRKLDKTVGQIISHSKIMLDNFIEKPDEMGLSEMEKYILTSLLTAPSLQLASQSRFFVIPTRIQERNEMVISPTTQNYGS